MPVTAYQYIAVTVSRRLRVAVAPITHQRQRGDDRYELLEVVEAAS